MRSPRRGLQLVLMVALAACGRGGQPTFDAGAPPGGDGGACDPIAGAKSAAAYASLSGVDANLLSLDVWAPPLVDSCARVPIVVWVHGGAWAIGDKANSMTDKVRLFNGAGWVVVSVNYRLSPDQASVDPNRVMYPMHPQDVANALHWVKTHAAEFHGDPTRLALLGHSAGAHLVALLSTDETFPAAQGDALSDVRCTGSFDTEGYDIPASLLTASPMQRQILENAFGTNEVVQRNASPKFHVAAAKGIPPFLIVVRGGPDREATETGFAQTLRSSGITATTIDAKSLTHEQVNDRIGAAGDRVMTEPIMQFLNACFL